ncbi:hypothetical protein MHU86_15163 [Fragilaria crotonensis]|nr:hypothetical protein MHU86_15163 [Fragilaria crotonensis]
MSAACIRAHTKTTGCSSVAKLMTSPSGARTPMPSKISSESFVPMTESTFAMKAFGIVQQVDVEQTDRYIKISCESYIDKLLAHYGWASSSSRETDEKPIEPICVNNATNVR